MDILSANNPAAEFRSEIQIGEKMKVSIMADVRHAFIKEIRCKLDVFLPNVFIPYCHALNQMNIVGTLKRSLTPKLP